jgi:hypothetical protein
MNKRKRLSAATASSVIEPAVEKKLRVVIIRHGEKPKKDKNGKIGDNLSCAGMNRALKLPHVLHHKFGKPDYTYVPSLTCGTFTDHSRMFQTVAPLAIKYDLTVNSEFDEKAAAEVAQDVKQKEGTVLMVWEHSAIQSIASELGVANSKPWRGKDFDSIWVIDFENGKASLTIDKEGLDLSEDCSF